MVVAPLLTALLPLFFRWGPHLLSFVKTRC